MLYRIICTDTDEVVSSHRLDQCAQAWLCKDLDRYKAAMVESEDARTWVLSELLVVDTGTEGCFVARTPQELEARVPETVVARVTDQRNVFKGSFVRGKFTPWQDNSPKPGTTWSSK
jgi:hypothetical protein